jgi:dipeptidase E
MKIKRQIIAMGGGGFSMEPENPLLDLYILKQSNKNIPKICFLGTASGDSEGYIENFYKSFSKMDCDPSHLSLFRPHTNQVEKFILSQDIIYVGGGNTKNMMVLWKEWNIHKALKKAYKQGIILSGLSAGSICWFEHGASDSIPGRLTRVNGLGFIEGSTCPHYDGESNRKPEYRRLLKGQKVKNGIALDDGAAVHFINEEFYKSVSSRPNAKAYKLYRKDSDIIEESLLTEYLG